MGSTGCHRQLWNAIGYSQAYHSMLIQPASWGGVYAVSFLIVAINSAIALLIIKRTPWTIAASTVTMFMVGGTIVMSAYPPSRTLLRLRHTERHCRSVAAKRADEGGQERRGDKRTTRTTSLAEHSRAARRLRRSGSADS